MLEDELAADPKLKKIMQDLVVDPGTSTDYCLRGGKLLYKDKMVLSKSSCRIPTILLEFHASLVGGHSGYFRIYKRISSTLFWEGMREDIKKFIEACDPCQKNKYQTLSPAGLLQPLPIPNQVWEDISMDFITGLPKTKGKDTILVVVDRRNKYNHFLPLAHLFTVKQVALLFTTEVIRLHGFPLSIVFDRDRLFLSSFWTELFRLAGTTIKYSFAYHPQTDGQLEVVNRCVETYLRCFVGERPFLWLQYLCWVEYWFNTNYHSTTQMTPFKALYGRDRPVLLRGNTTPTQVHEVATLIADKDSLLNELKQNLLKAQDYMKIIADKQ